MDKSIQTPQQPQPQIEQHNQLATSPARKLQKIVIAVLLFSILSLIGGGWYVLSTKQKTPSPKQDATIKHSVIPNLSISPVVSEVQSTYNAEVPKDWETLESKVCYLTIQYPSNWDGKVSEGRIGCGFSFSSPKEIQASANLTGIVKKNAWEDLLAEYPNSKRVIVAEVEGLEIEVPVPTYLKNVKGVAFHKGTVVFTFLFTYQPSTADILKVYEQMLASIRITGDPQTTIQDSSNPFTQEHNLQRWSDVTYLVNSIRQYADDNNGVFPNGITTVPKVISSNGANICSYLYPKYIPAIPVDPLTNKGEWIQGCPKTYSTNYFVVKSGSNVIVSAPAAEIGEQIAVTR